MLLLTETSPRSQSDHLPSGTSYGRDGESDTGSTAFFDDVASTRVESDDFSRHGDDVTSTVFDDTNSVHVAAKNAYYHESDAASISTFNSHMF